MNGHENPEPIDVAEKGMNSVGGSDTRVSTPPVFPAMQSPMTPVNSSTTTSPAPAMRHNFVFTNPYAAPPMGGPIMIPAQPPPNFYPMMVPQPKMNMPYQEEQCDLQDNYEAGTDSPNPDENKRRLKSRYDWDILELDDYAEILLSMMPRTVYSPYREKNHQHSGWYTFDVKAGMYICEINASDLHPHFVVPANFPSKELFYQSFNPSGYYMQQQHARIPAQGTKSKGSPTVDFVGPLPSAPETPNNPGGHIPASVNPVIINPYQ